MAKVRTGEIIYNGNVETITFVQPFGASYEYALELAREAYITQRNTNWGSEAGQEREFTRPDTGEIVRAVDTRPDQPSVITRLRRALTSLQNEHQADQIWNEVGDAEAHSQSDAFNPSGEGEPGRNGNGVVWNRLLKRSTKRSPLYGADEVIGVHGPHIRRLSKETNLDANMIENDADQTSYYPWPGFASAEDILADEQEAKKAPREQKWVNAVQVTNAYQRSQATMRREHQPEEWETRESLQASLPKASLTEAQLRAEYEVDLARRQGRTARSPKEVESRRSATEAKKNSDNAAGLHDYDFVNPDWP